MGLFLHPVIVLEAGDGDPRQVLTTHPLARLEEALQIVGWYRALGDRAGVPHHEIPGLRRGG
jgi:hypothetical protein